MEFGVAPDADRKLWPTRQQLALRGDSVCFSPVSLRKTPCASLTAWLWVHVCKSLTLLWYKTRTAMFGPSQTRCWNKEAASSLQNVMYVRGHTGAQAAGPESVLHIRVKRKWVSRDWQRLLSDQSQDPLLNTGNYVVFVFFYYPVSPRALCGPLEGGKILL